MRTSQTLVARRNFSQIIWFLSAAVAIILVTLQAPGPLVDRMLRADLLHEVTAYSARIVASLENGADTFSLGRVTTEDIEFLSRIPTASGIHMVNLYDPTGRVFYSTRPDLIGSTHEDARETATKAPGAPAATPTKRRSLPRASWRR